MKKMRISFKPILAALVKFRTFIIALAVLAICGYTAYQISVVVAAAPDPATIEQATAAAQSTVVRFDKKTIDTIIKQTPVQVAPDLHAIGTTNPFVGN